MVQTAIPIPITIQTTIPTRTLTQPTHAQLVQLGMKPQVNAFTAHYQTSLCKEMPKTDGNATAMPHTDLPATPTEQRPVSCDLTIYRCII